MESDFDIAALFASLGFLELSILILTAFFASVVSGISGYGGGMTLGLLVSPFIPVKLLVPLMSVFVLFSNLSRMYYYRKNIFWKKGFYFAIISTPFLIAGTNFYAAVSEKTLYFCLGFGLAFIVVLRRIFKKISDIDFEKELIFNSFSLDIFIDLGAALILFFLTLSVALK